MEQSTYTAKVEALSSILVRVTDWHIQLFAPDADVPITKVLSEFAAATKRTVYY